MTAPYKVAGHCMLDSECWQERILLCRPSSCSVSNGQAAVAVAKDTVRRSGKLLVVGATDLSGPVEHVLEGDTAIWHKSAQFPFRRDERSGVREPAVRLKTTPDELYGSLTPPIRTIPSHRSIKDVGQPFWRSPAAI